MKTKLIVMVSTTFVWSYMAPLIILFFHPITEVKIISAIWTAVAFFFAYLFLNSITSFGKIRKLVISLGPLAVMVLAIIWPIAK
ncbi:hypothetical protein KAR28_02620 [Candidatus Parcubacteria bacterium]|nr:hypothetical protein [Candidatus Parcubacteria bacterium]